MAIIEAITSDNSQAEKFSGDGSYSRYKYDETNKQWLWINIKGNECLLYWYSQTQDLKSIVASEWSEILLQWIDTDELTKKFSIEVISWVGKSCTLSMDTSKERVASIKTQFENLTGFDAIIRFQSWFKLLNSRERRISTAKKMFPYKKDSDLFHISKKGEIVGVKVSKVDLFNMYLLEMITKKEPGFETLRDWYIPTGTI